MSPRESILDPTGGTAQARSATLAARLPNLSGLRLGLLDNTKPNARLVLEAVATQLRVRHELGAVTSYTKSYFGTPVEAELAAEMARNCDFAVAGVGD